MPTLVEPVTMSVRSVPSAESSCAAVLHFKVAMTLARMNCKTPGFKDQFRALGFSAQLAYLLSVVAV